MTNDLGTSTDKDDMVRKMGWNSLYMLFIGIGVFVLCFLAKVLWNITTKAQAIEMQARYFSKLLKKKSSWFDERKASEISVRFNENVDNYKSIVSDKMHPFF